ncbi:MAG: hypothetical protein IJO48_01050 [Clostridia bacterium]|nr:hypothetical protein [Clostridia bacterium]
MIHRENYTVAFEDCGKSDEASVIAILRMAENAASRNSDDAGDSVISTSLSSGIAWVMVEWNAKFVRLPKYGEKLSISTWSRWPENTRSVRREYLICAENGEHCVELSSKFMLLDLKSGSIVQLNEEFMKKYDPEDCYAFDISMLGLLREPKQYESETRLTLRRSDIDFNAHVHNLNYLNFALEALPEAVYDKADYDSLRIIFRKALKADDDVVCRYASNGDEHTVGIYGGDDVLRCIVQLKSK